MGRGVRLGDGLGAADVADVLADVAAGEDPGVDDPVGSVAVQAARAIPSNTPPPVSRPRARAIQRGYPREP